MATKLNMTLLLRRDDFTAEAKKSYVLQAGEPGYCTATKAFKVGDNTTTWENLPIANKTQIDAIVNAAIAAHAAGYYTKEEIDEIVADLQDAIDTKLAAETFNTWKGTHENGHAPSATQIASDIAAAVLVEENARKAADNAINAKIGDGFDDGDNTVAKKIAAAIAEAESKDEARAATTATNLASAVSALETMITDGDSNTLAAAKSYTDQEVGKEAAKRAEEDGKLDTRLAKVEAFFKGAAEDATVEGELINALDTLKEIQEFATGEGTAATEMLDAIQANADAIDELANETDGRVTVAEGKIATLEGEFAEGGRVKAAEDEINVIKQKPAYGITVPQITNWNAELGAKELAQEVTNVVNNNKEIWDKAGTALQADDLTDGTIEATFKTLTVSGEDSGSRTHINGGNIEIQYGSLSLDGLASNNPEAFKITGWEQPEGGEGASYITTIGASAASFGGSVTAADKVTAPEFVGDLTGTAARATADAAGNVITETYATKEEVSAIDVGVTKVTAAGTDIVVTPTAGTGAVTVAHKDYGSGTLTKDPAALENGDAYVFTGLDLSNGHVTGGAMKSLADILSSMTFIFDGGTATTNV